MDKDGLTTYRAVAPAACRPIYAAADLGSLHFSGRGSAQGLPETLIAREDRSAGTEENLRFSRRIMEEAKPGYRCVIVTNNYHSFRAAVLARREGVKGQAVGCRTSGCLLPSAAFREFSHRGIREPLSQQRCTHVPPPAPAACSGGAGRRRMRLRVADRTLRPGHAAATPRRARVRWSG